MDGNVLAALMINSHVHHLRARSWFRTLHPDNFATCATTQGTLLGVHMVMAADSSAAAAWATLHSVCRHPKHQFWAEGMSYEEVDPSRLTGQKQVTDAWLAEVTRRRNGKLITLDSALTLLHPDVATLLPPESI